MVKHTSIIIPPKLLKLCLFPNRCLFPFGSRMCYVESNMCVNGFGWDHDSLEGWQKNKKQKGNLKSQTEIIEMKLEDSFPIYELVIINHEGGGIVFYLISYTFRFCCSHFTFCWLCHHSHMIDIFSSMVWELFEHPV